MDENFFAGEWPLLSQAVRSHAAVMGRLLSAEAGDLLAAQTERFCGQSPPADAAGLVTLTIDQAAFAGRASIIAHADAMARMHPGVAAAVLGVAREACEPDFPATAEEAATQSLALAHASERISLLCYEDAIRRLTSG